MLSAIEKKIILELAARQITIAEFYRSYPTDIASDNSYVLRVLQSSLVSKDAEAVEYMSYLRGFRKDVEDLSLHAEVLLMLLAQDWHRSHEYIVDSLEILGFAKAIGVLCQRALGTLSYLDALDNESLRKRCVYAISKIGGIEAMRALKILSKDGAEPIRELACQLLVTV